MDEDDDFVHRIFQYDRGQKVYIRIVYPARKLQKSVPAAGMRPGRF
jgi:hypothetical protein